LFPNHPYGTQTTIGTIEDLKNPSLTEIQKYLEQNYVPNNMVITISGDIDPDQTIEIINRAFGSMTSVEVKPFKPASEKLIKQPIVREVYGPDAESILMGFRFAGAGTRESDMLTMVDMILSNGEAGLLDLNLNTAQKVLNAYSTTYILKDYSIHMLGGRPKEGQTLEQLRDLLLGQIMELKMCNFP